MKYKITAKRTIPLDNEEARIRLHRAYAIILGEEETEEKIEEEKPKEKVKEDERETN